MTAKPAERKEMKTQKEINELQDKQDKNEKWNPKEDLSVLCGMFLMSSFIFVIRNVSVITGINLPFSGNVNMSIQTAEWWRYIMFAAAVSASSVFFRKVYRLAKREKKKAWSYIKLFFSGIGIIFAFEAFFWMEAYAFRT